ncbi:MAG TPA: hypothetical protein DDX91_02420 [Ruminococcaceae bacterium]|nr:hypothetical protein [Oscillospiraceae bacterium]
MLICARSQESGADLCLISGMGANLCRILGKLVRIYARFQESGADLCRFRKVLLIYARSQERAANYCPLSEKLAVIS